MEGVCMTSTGRKKKTGWNLLGSEETRQLWHVGRGFSKADYRAVLIQRLEEHLANWKLTRHLSQAVAVHEDQSIKKGLIIMPRNKDERYK